MTQTNRATTQTIALWLALLVATTLVLLVVRAELDKAHVALAYLLIVLGSSSAGGRILGLSIAGGAFLAFNYLFLPPYYTLVIANPIDWLVLVAFLITSIVAAQLLYRANVTADTATRRAEEVDRLAMQPQLWWLWRSSFATHWGLTAANFFASTLMGSWCMQRPPRDMLT